MGSIEVIVGCMFSGKSEELIRRLKRLSYTKKSIVVFKPVIDKRWNRKNELVSRNGTAFGAYPVLTPIEIREKGDAYDIVAVDEAHFFVQSFITVVEDLRDAGKQVLIAGLDLDFRREPFEHIARVLAIADSIVKLDAICVLCGGRAMLTQRLIDGRPAPRNAERIQIGDDEYQARCRGCHVV